MFSPFHFPFFFPNQGLMTWSEVWFSADLVLAVLLVLGLFIYSNLKKRSGKTSGNQVEIMVSVILVLVGFVLVFLLPPWGNS